MSGSDDDFRRVAVIGGGPAGMMAAGISAQTGAETVLIEKNRVLGKKLLITGKGRCNVTNNTDFSGLCANIPTNPKFMYSAFSGFSARDTMDFFENSGVKLKTERGNRVFPVSDKSSDIRDALYGFCVKQNVKFVMENVFEIVRLQNSLWKIRADGGTEILCGAVIIATGGLSYPGTGSTGDGYVFAKALGHRIIPTRPSLVGLAVSGSECAGLAGLSLKNIGIKIYRGNSQKAVYDDFGEMLFTHTGVSGPVILSASAHMKDVLSAHYTLSVDFKPALEYNTLDKRLIRDIEACINKDAVNALSGLLPVRLLPFVLKRAGIDERIKANLITKEMRGRLTDVLKNYTYSIISFESVNEAVVTAGGVDTKEINSKTMESKLAKGVFFAGEVIDVDGYTGGFNLQIAFSTGFTAGRYAARQVLSI